MSSVELRKRSLEVGGVQDRVVGGYVLVGHTLHNLSSSESHVGGSVQGVVGEEEAHHVGLGVGCSKYVFAISS